MATPQTTFPAERVRWANLSGRQQRGDEPAIVLLHGLTFDRRMWNPIIDRLPGRRVLAVDLPGHGASPMPDRRGLSAAVDAVHEAVMEAGVNRPVMVGHSIGGPIATIYAGEHPVSAVISIEAPIRVETFAAGMRAAAPHLRGTEFDQTWSRFRDSFGIERVPTDRRGLLAAGYTASQDVVLFYQSDLLDRPLDEIVCWRDAALARIAAAGTPYLTLHANPQAAEDVRWLNDRLPQAQTVVWPIGHHFPHLQQPDQFAQLVTRMAERAPLQNRESAA
jgi:pimeloyl-ACP methyl ester carboxylesterase